MAQLIQLSSHKKLLIKTVDKSSHLAWPACPSPCWVSNCRHYSKRL